MRQRTMKAVRRVLEDKQRQLERLAREAREQDLDILEGERSDEIDLASAEVLQGFALRLRTRERRLSGKILEALRRMDDGTFGICEECEEDISIARLQARPEARLCMDCKEDEEHHESKYVH